MVWPSSPRKLAGVVAAVFGAALLFAPASYAQSGSLNLEQTTPLINFDFDGRIRYVGDMLEVDATPLFAQVAEFLPPAQISDGTVLRDFVIRVRVDNAGNLLGSNIPGQNDLVIQGRAFGPGTNFDGILLTGKVRPANAAAQSCRPAPTSGPCRGFGFLTTDSGTDFEFRFQVTGGLLASNFENDIYVRATGIGLVVNGDLASTFAGGPADGFHADGSAGQVPLPTGVLLPPTITGSNITTPATGPYGAAVVLGVMAMSSTGIQLQPTCSTGPIPIPANAPYTFPIGTMSVNCTASDAGGVANLTITVTVTPLMAPPPVVTVYNTTVEAMGVLTPVMFDALASDANGPVPVTCDPASGSSFPLGTTPVTCTASNSAGTTMKTLLVTVQDTMPPVILGGKVEVEANAVGGATVVLPWTAKDLASGDLVLPVTCDNVPAGSFFPIGTTYLQCHADDGRGNSVSETFEVSVTVEPPKFPGGSCFIVDFREITYFRNQTVLMSSDPAIRAAAGISGAFAPAVWPYRASGGTGYTKSKGTLFRLYGFQPSEVGQLIPDADQSFRNYPVQYDADSKGYYIDMGGPARVFICPEQLHNYVLAGLKGNGHMDGSTLLPPAQRNVPGVMLTHNTQILKLPRRISQELATLGMSPGSRGEIAYLGVQLQGNGSAEFREFIDIEISFPGDSETNRVDHFKSGLHTATNVNFESFAGCNYVDYAPGNDAVRLRDIWGPNRSKKQGYQNWRACGSREPFVNRRVRANYDLPFNAVQLLPTVNTGTDTLRIFFGDIRVVVATDRQRRDHRTDWRDWDLWDF